LTASDIFMLMWDDYGWSGAIQRGRCGSCGCWPARQDARLARGPVSHRASRRGTLEDDLLILASVLALNLTTDAEQNQRDSGTTSGEGKG